MPIRARRPPNLFHAVLLSCAVAMPVAAQRVTPLAVRPIAAASTQFRQVEIGVHSDSASHRPWWRYPVIGAVVLGVGGQLVYLSQCVHNTDDGCMGGPAPLGFGGVVGASLGGIAELVHRGVERARRP